MKRNGQTILFLPDAGPDNPFQYLLVEELRHCGHTVYLGKKRRVFSLLLETLKRKPDIVYFDWVHSFLIGEKLVWTLIKSFTFVLEVCIVKFVMRKRILHTIHNIHSHAQRSLALERFFYSWFLQRCDNVRVYDESTVFKVKDFLGVTLSNYIVSPDLPYSMHYKDRASREKARTYLKLPSASFIYLFIGNVKPYKGVEELIQAFNDPSFRKDMLLIAGRVAKGEYLKQLLSLIEGKENIRLCNEFITENELKYYMAAADVAVFPFRNIEHSGSVELAMTFEKPVITRNVPSIYMLLAKQKEFLYQDAHELASRMKAIKQAHLEDIGKSNYHVIASTDYSRLIRFFDAQ